MDMRAAVIRPGLPIMIAMLLRRISTQQRPNVGMPMAGVVQMLVHERVCLGELRRVQNR